MTTQTRPAPLTFTAAAARRVRQLLEQSGQPALGLRIGIRNRGCSGMSYSLDYVYEEIAGEDKIEGDGFCLYLDPSALMFIIGSEMDYQDDRIHSGFVFNNPNATAHCGCGESFTVDRTAPLHHA